ncbi:MAG: hypothetical protein QOJ98_3574 [Acidobacteriota bacterium]|jgi:hypothetical protein|nr:hypothetical protein [Acidobacteriota bacterium]
MSYFQAVRLYSMAELAVFSTLLVVWIGGLDDGLKEILGWTHGFGWIGLCVAIFAGCGRGVFPWPVLAAAVSPLGPLGSTIGIEWTAHRRRRPTAMKGA